MIVPYANQEMQINGVVAVIVEKDCPAQNNARHYNGKEVATAVMNSNEYALTLFGVAVLNRHTPVPTSSSTQVTRLYIHVDRHVNRGSYSTTKFPAKDEKSARNENC